jgi:plasmid stability protein
MPNMTISLDEDLLKAGRSYAKKHNTSMNALIRKLLEQTVTSKSRDWLDECFRLMDRAKVNSRGQRWKREDLYDV